jgi:hypothetical protein
MSTTGDWLPGTREGILAMAKTWLIVIVANLQKRGIPESVLQALPAPVTAADSALAAAQNESTRTPVATARCKEVFDALSAEMRDIKKHYFLSLPLTDAGYVSLGLTPHDTTLTASGAPAAHIPWDHYGRMTVYTMGDW